MLSPEVLGILARRSGDFDAAEDAVQEALIAAAERWPHDGVPPNPRAWLLLAAGRRLTDALRSDRSRVDRERLVARMEPGAGEGSDADDSLMLLFLCCHPALTHVSAVALTLRAVGGLTTAQIARAYLVPEATMAQRISRAKATIRASGVPFALPDPAQRPARIGAVLRVLYLLYNEGHTTSTGDTLLRVDLSDEAIRLARLLHHLLADDGEVTGLLALLVLIDARRPARLDADGDPVPLADQDRSRWDRTTIREGTALLDAAIGHGPVGPYQLQAAIAAVHDRASRAADTDWPQILALYGLLERVAPNPVVTLNRAVAAGEAQGPAAGLAILERVVDPVRSSHRHAAVKGHLLELAGDREGAFVAYRTAARLATNVAEQRSLTRAASRVRVRPLPNDAAPDR